MTHENSTSFLDTYFDYLPEDMQREIINRCYKRPAPKHCYGDMVVLTQEMQETIETIETTNTESGQMTRSHQMMQAEFIVSC